MNGFCPLNSSQRRRCCAANHPTAETSGSSSASCACLWKVADRLHRSYRTLYAVSGAWRHFCRLRRRVHAVTTLRGLQVHEFPQCFDEEAASSCLGRAVGLRRSSPDLQAPSDGPSRPRGIQPLTSETTAKTSENPRPPAHGHRRGLVISTTDGEYVKSGSSNEM